MRTVISRAQWQSQQLFRSYWGLPVWQSRWINQRWKPASQKPLTAEVSAKQPIKQAPHNTCGSCWLGTAQQFYHDMRGERGSRLTSKLKQGTHVHQPTAWPIPHTCAQPYHAGSGSHEQLFRPYWGLSAWHSRRSVTGENACFFLFRGGHTWQSAMPSHPFNNTEHRHNTTTLNDTRLYVTS